jgi:hypothetical protein
MAIIPEKFQEDLDYVLQQNMTYTPSALHNTPVTKKRIEVLQDLSQPSSFDNYIDVMQQFIDLAHNILSDGVNKPPPKFSGEGWDGELSRLQLHFKAFTDNIMKLAGSGWELTIEHFIMLIFLYL